jgi:hypothetical protein
VSADQPLTGPRVIVTGSRDWDDARTIRLMLARYNGPGTVLVHGGCPTGADAIADAFARENGWTVEVHPADWSKGKSAGPRRNREMAELGADVCLAFHKDNSRGTQNMINNCHKNGIPVSEYLYVKPTGVRGGWGG